MKKRTSIFFLAISVLLVVVSGVGAGAQRATGGQATVEKMLAAASKGDVQAVLSYNAMDAMDALGAALLTNVSQQDIWELMRLDRSGVTIERVELLGARTEEIAANRQAVTAFYKVTGVKEDGAAVAYSVRQQYDISKTGNRWLIDSML